MMPRRSRTRLLQWMALLVTAGSLGASRLQAATQAVGNGGIRGRVSDESGGPIAGARILLAGAGRTIISDEQGRFRFSELPPGRYELRALHIGFVPLLDSISVTAGVIEHVDRTLKPAVRRLSEVVVTPGAFVVLDQTSPSQMTLSREVMQAAPQLGEDIFRSLGRIPGVSGADFSAKVRIRNGGTDEQLVRLDGLEIIEPFHLKDFDGALSMVDADALSSVAVTTGGFGAALGNRMAGVVELVTANPTRQRGQTAIGLSLLNVRARNEGTFHDGRGAWMLSARRGYLDLVLKLVGEDDPPDPKYYDVFGKLQYRLSSRHELSTRALVTGDNLYFRDTDNGAVLNSAYGNRYLWSIVASQLAPGVRTTTLASLAQVTWNRDGYNPERLNNREYPSLELADRRTLHTMSVKQDWIIDATPRVSVIFGGEARRESADYAYARRAIHLTLVNNQLVLGDTSRVTAGLRPAGERLSAYASLRSRIGGRVTTDIGARTDRHSWTGQATFSPRANLAVDIAPQTTLRSAWGWYHQGEALNDLSVVDGDTAFVHAERAEHRVISVDRVWQGKWSTRVEVYQRHITNPRARFINTDGNIDVLAEGAQDRLRLAPSRATVRGLEVFGQYDGGGKWRTSASYVLSDATMMVDGVKTHRPYAEPHAFSVDVGWRASGGWTLSSALTARSGWPIVPARYVLAAGNSGNGLVRRVPPTADFSGHLSAYSRLDVRASRLMQTRHGSVRVYADLFNVLGHANQRGTDYTPVVTNTGEVRARSTPLTYFGRLPSLGASWEF